MHATIPKSASATWRAIVAGRSALKAGLISRVGDGSTISVWEDNWIPGTASMTPTMSPADTVIDRVSDLIDTDHWTWKHDVITENFTIQDAAAILNIPIRQGGGEDFLAWAFDKSGNYTVKTVYRALVTQNEHLAQEEGTATETSTDDQ